MRSTFNRPCIGIIAIAITGIYTPAVSAQDVVLEEIIVTAQRRQESLQEVPISISAFTSETLIKSNITEAKDYLSFAPNVSFTEDGEAGSRSINISIRGVSNVSLGEVVTANSIGYYIDELNVGTVAKGTINPQLQDMERIEVLRGPQGTYYGRNAVGGAINITTKKPTDEFYAQADIHGGSFSKIGASGILNLPLSENLMVRALVGLDSSDGPVENVNPGGSELGYDYRTGRLSVLALLSESMTLDISATRTEEKEGGDISVPSGVVDLDTQSIFGATFVPIDDQLGFYPTNTSQVNRNTPEKNDNSFTIINGRLSWDLDIFSLHLVTGYIDSDNDRVFDQDNVSADALVRFNHYEGSSLSQELRLQSNDSSAINWVAGLFYADDEIEQFNSIQAGSEGSYTDPVSGEVIGLLPPIPAGFRINENNRIFKVRSFAVFAEGTIPLDESWSFTLGGRYSQDQIDNFEFDTVSFEDALADVQGKETFNDFSPKLVLRYIPADDLTLYGSISKGYKSGGVDVSSTSVRSPVVFDSENLINYELGFKKEFSGRSRLSGALFALDWSDMQVQSNYLATPGDISSAVEATQNAEKASSLGAEFEFQTLLRSDLTWSFNLGLQDAQFDDFFDARLKGSTNDNPNVVNVSGQDLPKTPKLTMSSILDYTREFNSGQEVFLRAEWIYRSSSLGDIEAVGAEVGMTVSGDTLVIPDFPYKIDSYSVVNLRAGIGNEHTSLNAFVKNVFDQEYYTGTADNFGLAGIRLRPHPIEFGINLVMKTNIE